MRHVVLLFRSMRAGRIALRELRDNLSRTLRRARRRDAVDAGTGPLGDLIAAGKIRPPRQAGALPSPLVLSTRMTGEEAIDVLRGK